MVTRNERTGTVTGELKNLTRRARPAWRRLPALLAAGLAVAGGACDRATAPSATEGFIAIITRTEGPAEIDPGQGWDLHVLEASGTLGIDLRQRIEPNDTVILTVPPATYDITVDGAPLACTSRSGSRDRATIFEPGQTFTARFVYNCSSLLAIRTATDGALIDEEFAYRHTGPDGVERVGAIAANDTVRLDDITPGTQQVDLLLVADNCVILNDGGRSLSAEVSLASPALLDYRVRCSDPAEAPTLLHFGSSYGDSLSVFYFEATDPDPNGPLAPPFPDIDRFNWNLTDCNGFSVLGRDDTPYAITGFTAQGLSLGGSRSAGADTVRIATVLPVGLADGLMDGRCTTLRVEDRAGNTTPIAQDRIGDEAGSPPVVNLFNVWTDNLNPNFTYLIFDVDATDPDGDLAGTYVRFLFVDGTFGPPDGEPDAGAYSIQGFVGTEVTDLLLRTPSFNRGFTEDDILETRVYVIDREGNFSVAVDGDAVN